MAKLLVFLAILLGAQTAIAMVYPYEIPMEIQRFRTYLENDVDVIYFGDSTVWHPRGSQTIAEMLQERLPDATVGELSHAAYSMDLYLQYVDYMVRHGYHPKLVIIPINMRSFSPEWDQRPGYQFTEEKEILAYGIGVMRLWGRPFRLFGGFDPDITHDEFLHTTVYSGTVPVGQVQDFEAIAGGVPLEDQIAEQFIYYQAPIEEADLADLLTYYYMEQLDAEHRKVQAMLEIVDLLQSHDTDLLFYITPINVELGDAYADPSFRRQFAQNTALIRRLLAERDTPLLDLSTDLQAFYFSDTEHLRPDGKQYVATQLAAAIDPTAIDNVVRSVQPTATPAAPAVATPTDSVAEGTATEDAPNPLLATAMARATIAAAPVDGAPVDDASENGSADGVVATATPSPTNTVAPEDAPNPLLATARARATTAARDARQLAETPTPPQ